MKLIPSNSIEIAGKNIWCVSVGNIAPIIPKPKKNTKNIEKIALHTTPIIETILKETADIKPITRNNSIIFFFIVPGTQSVHVPTNVIQKETVKALTGWINKIINPAANKV
jgi:hypothetical protein